MIDVADLGIACSCYQHVTSRSSHQASMSGEQDPTQSAFRRVISTAPHSALSSLPLFSPTFNAWDRHYSDYLPLNVISLERAVSKLKIIFRDFRSVDASRLSPTDFSGLWRVFQGVVLER